MVGSVYNLVITELSVVRIEHTDCTFNQLWPLDSISACLFKHRQLAKPSFYQHSIINQIHLLVAQLLLQRRLEVPNLSCEIKSTNTSICTLFQKKQMTSVSQSHNYGIFYTRCKCEVKTDLRGWNWKRQLQSTLDTSCSVVITLNK
jgi:hypothetical protein